MKNIYKNKNLKTAFLSLFILANTICFSQENKCKNQIKIIKTILSDVQFKDLTVSRDTIKIENSFCIKIKNSLRLDGKQKIILSFLKERTKSDDKISFIEYEETNKIIFSELSIFHKNAIYSILLKKQDSCDLILIDSWMKFVK